MEQWIIPLYIISGIVMAIGGYFSYKYKPYCLFDSPERELAMKLRRKKLREKELGVKDEMTSEEKKQYAIFERIHYADSFWRRRVLFISISVHLILLLTLSVSPLNWANQMPLYYISGILLLVGGRAFYTGASLNLFCVSDLEFRELAILESHYKQMHGYQLDKEDERNIKNTRWQIKESTWQRRILFTGLWVHLFASIAHVVLIVIN